MVQLGILYVSLFIVLKLCRGLGCGNGFRHKEQAYDYPCDDGIDDHRKEGRPLNGTARDDGRAEHRKERFDERPADGIDKATESRVRVCSCKSQEETECQNDLEEIAKVPDHLRDTEERFRGGGIVSVHAYIYFLPAKDVTDGGHGGFPA
jgi:hypothetical protein